MESLVDIVTEKDLGTLKKPASIVESADSYELYKPTGSGKAIIVVTEFTGKESYSVFIFYRHGGGLAYKSIGFNEDDKLEKARDAVLAFANLDFETYDKNVQVCQGVVAGSVSKIELGGMLEFSAKWGHLSDSSVVQIIKVG
jgi:hypothetical protein